MAGSRFNESNQPVLSDFQNSGRNRYRSRPVAVWFDLVWFSSRKFPFWALAPLDHTLPPPIEQEYITLESTVFGKKNKQENVYLYACACNHDYPFISSCLCYFYLFTLLQ